MGPERRREDVGRREGKKRHKGRRKKKNMKSPARYHLDLWGKSGR